MNVNTLPKLTIVGWIAFLFFLYLVSRTTDGHEVIYLGLILIITFLLVSDWPRIQQVVLKK